MWRPRNKDTLVSMTTIMDQQSVASARTHPPGRLVFRVPLLIHRGSAYPNYTARAAAQRHELMPRIDAP